ncbi:hypothetical protein CVT26_011991 [Gymnopilus dilepis]|uniref:Major facilitator superfamily (MFS) profile domain-containing protein n=1 Tax=Gymnopilus dilepis TaxID=231916 RepID=A0A409VYL1_9AGAR|nr:hypothetical protein CVT26_011991 [Gymnopilus dilepis]
MGVEQPFTTEATSYKHLIATTKPWSYYIEPLYMPPVCDQLHSLHLKLVQQPGRLITSSTSGYDGSMMNGLQSVQEWEIFFHFPHGSTLGLFNAIQNIGSLATYPIAPYFADGLGRRSTIFIGAVIMVCATVLQAAAQSFGMFIAARFLIGFGLAFSFAAAPLLISEIAYPTQRAQLTSVYNTLWAFGSIIAAWTTFGTFRIPNNWSWRIPSALQGLPSVIQVLLIWFIPESPRYLINMGKEDRALHILAYYHANGNQNDPLVRYEFEEIKAAIAFDKEVAENVGWLSLFKTPGNRRRMRIIIALAFFSQWSGNGLVSYYLNKVLNDIGITSSDTQLLINGILTIFNFVIAIIAGFMVERIGRRPLFMTSIVGMLVFWTMQSVCFAVYIQDNTKTAAAHSFIAMIFLFSAFYDIAFTPLIVSYTVEILPYPLRAKGFTIFNFSISLSLIFNQYINPIALGKLGWKYYMVYVAWDVFEVIYCYLFIVETKGLSLEETAVLFDGKDTVAMLSEKAAAEAGILPSGNNINLGASERGSSNEKIEI